MSIVHTLKKLVDPVRAEMEEVRRKAERERPDRDDDGSSGKYQCTLCGMLAQEREYCPDCLAPTMKPAPKD